MAWPPPVLPVNRTDALYQQGNHPADHNAANGAINDIVGQVQYLSGFNIEARHVVLSLAGGTYLTPTRRNLQPANMGTRGFNRLAIVTCGVLFNRTGGAEQHFDLWTEASAGLIGYPSVRTRALIGTDSYGGANIVGIWGIPANVAAVFTPSLSAANVDIYGGTAGGEDMNFLNVATVAAPGTLTLLP